MVCTGIALTRFDVLKRLWNIGDDSEFVSQMVDSLREAPMKKKTDFICTLPEQRSIKIKVEEVLSRAGDVPELLSMGWIDQAVLPDLLKLAEGGVKLRLILPMDEKKTPDRGVRDALKQLQKPGINIKTNNMLHARILVVGDREAIIGSSDLKTDSLDQNREAGIYTTDPVIVRHAIDFFNMVWEGS